MFFGIIGFVIYETYKNKKWGTKQYVYSLLVLSVAIGINAIDFHWCRVVSYRAKVAFRIAKKEEKRKKLEEEE